MEVKDFEKHMEELDISLKKRTAKIEAELKEEHKKLVNKKVGEMLEGFEKDFLSYLENLSKADKS